MSHNLHAFGVHYAFLSDVGMRRPVNQDSHAQQVGPSERWRKQGHLFVVADGMGAHAAGELASRQAVDEIVRRYQPHDVMSARTDLIRVIEKANAEIHRRGREDTELYNMGTTCSTLALLPEGAVVAHVGDSRVYRCRKNQIQQLTFDHSLVWEMRAAGQLGKDDERNSVVPRNVITRCLGPHPEVQVDVEGPFSVQVGDVFLLCSDGLTGRISDAEIGTILLEMSPDESARFLVDLANLRGGTDNITVVIVQVTEDGICTSTRHDSKSNALAFSPSGARRIDPLWWLVLGAAILLAVGALSLNQWIVAALAGAVALLCVIAVTIPLFKSPTSPDAPTMGEAPYKTATCAVDQSFVASISETLKVVLDGLSLPKNESTEIRSTLDSLTAGDRSANVCVELAGLSNRLLKAVREELGSVTDSSWERLT